MKTYTRIAATLLFSLACMGMQAEDYAVTSPNGHLKATVSDNGRIEWTITHEATDYKHVSRKVTPSDKLTVHLAPAGGWTARFSY